MGRDLLIVVRRTYSSAFVVAFESDDRSTDDTKGC